MEHLLLHGADVNIQTRYGNTALMLAAFNGHLSCVEYLLSRGADVKKRNSAGNTALMLAESSGLLPRWSLYLSAWSRCKHPEK